MKAQRKVSQLSVIFTEVKPGEIKAVEKKGKIISLFTKEQLDELYRDDHLDQY